MKVFLRWIIIYFPAAIVCLVGFFLAGLAVFAGTFDNYGDFDTFSTLGLIMVFGAFVLPPLVLSLSSFLFLKITRKIKLPALTRSILAFFWIPLLIIYYLIFFAPSLLILLIMLIAILTVITFVRKLVSTNPKA